MSADILDATGRFRRLEQRLRVVPALQVVEHATPGAYDTLILKPDVTIGELLHALRGTDLVVSTEGPFQFLHRKPQPPDAAA